jgi:hypothetical protein
MKKVVPFFKSLKIIFYFKKIEPGKFHFLNGQSLKGFEFHFNPFFEFKSNLPRLPTL